MSVSYYIYQNIYLSYQIDFIQIVSLSYQLLVYFASIKEIRGRYRSRTYSTNDYVTSDFKSVPLPFWQSSNYDIYGNVTNQVLYSSSNDVYLGLLGFSNTILGNTLNSLVCSTE